MHLERQIEALQMHGSGTTSNVLTMLLGAHTTAGFAAPGHYRPDPQTFIAYPPHEHEVARQLRLIEALGVPLQGDWLEFPITPVDRQALQAIDGAHVLQPGEYVCVHPGASTPTHCWPPQRFARVADALAEQGLQVVLTGSAAERELAATVAQAMRAPALNLAGRTELGALGALLHQSRLVVCNDTGVSHLAAAVGTTSVVIFMEDARRQWAPLNHHRHRALYDPRGVTVDAVLHHAQDLLWRVSVRALVHSTGAVY
jgi:ADP-heptose:LPS heptosyltransferase